VSNARPFRRRRLTPSQSDLASILGPLDGAQVPGGCEHCDAYQTVHPTGPGTWVVAVHHDGWCVQLRRLDAS